MKTKVKQYFIKYAGLILILFFLILTALSMKAISEFRIYQLHYSLENAGQKFLEGKSLVLIARYKLLKNRLEKGEDSIDSISKETRLMVIQSENYSKLYSFKQKNLFFIKAGYILTGIFEFFAEDRPHYDFSKNKVKPLLEIAYIYERQRNYNKAIQAYNAAESFLKKNKTYNSYLNLHRGFCYSLNENFSEAAKNYQKTINLAPESEMAASAEILMTFFFNVHKQKEKVKNSKTSLNKAQNLYLLMAYKKAIQVLNKIENKMRDAKYYFLKGGSYEGMGELLKALKNYRKSIKRNLKSNWARKANRRLYLIGNIYKQQKNLIKEAKKNALKQDDMKFIKHESYLLSLVSNSIKLKNNSIYKDSLEYIKYYYQNKKDSKSDVKEIALTLKNKPGIKKNKIAGKEKSKAPFTIASLLNPKMGMKERKILLKKNFQKLDKIVLSNGSIFIGKVISEGNIISIISSFGLLKIPKKEILSRVKIDSSKIGN